jgi:gamma-glutamylputrescine oxidase
VTVVDEKGVSTEAGRLDAPWVILACNGYLDGLDRAAAAHVMPLNNFILATEPLGERTPVPGGECVCDTRVVLNYFRPDAAGRLIFGGGEKTGARFPDDIAAFVRRPLARVFPQLADVRVEHAWGGTLAITPNRTPLFRREGQRLVIGGWSGAGVHMATMGGMIAAEAVRGTLARWDVMARVPSPAFPGGTLLRPALLALAFAWAGLRDRL